MVSEEVAKRIISDIVPVVPKREFIHYVLTIIKNDNDMIKLAEYIENADNPTEEEIAIRAMDIKLHKNGIEYYKQYTH